MTILLAQAIQEAEKLPEAAQNQVARQLLAEIDHVLAKSDDEDETAYLMRSPANRAVLLRRIEIGRAHV